MNDVPRILHVEVGGSYGGSLRALERCLAHSDRGRFDHEILLYYPTRGTERLAVYCQKVMTLCPKVPSSFTIAQATSQSALRNALKNSPLAPVLLAAREWLAIVRDLPTVRRLRQILVSARYDLVHVNNSFTYQVPTLVAAKLARIPVVAHMRNPIDANTFSRAMMRLVDCVVTVNQAFERELNSWGVPVPVRTCYDSVEIPLVDQCVSSHLRATLAPPGTVLVGSAGRLDAQKGYADFIRAARLVADANPLACFAIVGDGPLRESLLKLVDNLKLTARFRLCGFRGDVGNFLRALDLYVCSSLFEGLPLTIVEAMLLGKPVVATDVGGNYEVVVPGRTGVLVPPSSPEKLAGGILKLVNDQDLRGRLAAAAQEGVKEFLDGDARAGELETVFAETISRAGAKRHSA